MWDYWVDLIIISCYVTFWFEFGRVFLDFPLSTSSSRIYEVTKCHWNSILELKDCKSAWIQHELQKVIET